MKKIAVFGNTGGGKSTLAKRLAELTHIPLYPLDTIQYRAGGGKVPDDEYVKAHGVLWLCHRRLTPKYRALVSAVRQHKRVHHLRSAAEMDVFLYGFTQEAPRV